MPGRSFAYCALLGLGALAGCSSPSAPGGTGGTVTELIPASPDLDLLFVIDNSSGLADKQAVFAASFAKLVAAFDAWPAGRPNLHVGVVDTTVDLGGGGSSCPSPDPDDNGRLQSTARVPGCSPPNGSFISDVATAGGGRAVNYTGTLDAALSCIAQVGASGCEFPAPLEAMKRALDGTNPGNAGFVRADALLAIVVLTDRDDASTKDASVFGMGGPFDPVFAYQCDQPISPTAPGTYTGCKPRTDSYLQDPAFYAQFLAGVKDPAQIVVSVIAGPPPGLTTDDVPGQQASSQDLTVGPLSTAGGTTQPLAVQPSCTATINGNPAIGLPAIRLASFLGAYGARGRFYSICQTDYAAALADISTTLQHAISPCLAADVSATDIEPANPGTQPDCTVSDVQNRETATQTETVIPACKMTDATTPDANGARPCWWTRTDPVGCPAPGGGLALEVERGSTTPPPGDEVSIECAAGS